MNISKIIFNFIFIASILFNLLFLLEYSNLPTYQLGVLKQALKIEDFYGKKVLFELPKGMAVMNNSPRNIASAGLFSPNRITFSIMVSSDSVDYSQSPLLTYTDSLYESSNSTD